MGSLPFLELSFELSIRTTNSSFPKLYGVSHWYSEVVRRTRKARFQEFRVYIWWWHIWCLRASHPLLRGLYRLLVSLSFLLLLFQPFLYPFWSCMRTLREDDFLFPSKASFVLLLPRYFYFFFAFFLLPRFPRFNTIFPGQQGHIKASSFSLVARSLLSFSRRRCEGTRGGAAREDAVDDDGLIGATD